MCVGRPKGGEVGLESSVFFLKTWLYYCSHPRHSVHTSRIVGYDNNCHISHSDTIIYDNFCGFPHGTLLTGSVFPSEKAWEEFPQLVGDFLHPPFHIPYAD